MSTDKIAIISFYSFIDITDPELLIPKLLYLAKKKSVKGTILLSEEGFNGSLSGREEFVNLVIDKLVELSQATVVSRKTNYSDTQPFSKVKIKLKDEIVSMKAGYIDVNGKKGEYISSNEWDSFISRDDVILIDTRNDYEVEVGTFEGAINPHTETFREFPKWTEENKELLAGKKIAMCCTGGIRCEKSTAYLKELGYEEVYHLEGGILQYLEDTKNESGKWLGECFVFDDRGAVNSLLEPAEGYWVEKGQTAKNIKRL